MSQGPENRFPDEPVPNPAQKSRSYEAYCSLDDLFRKPGMDARQRGDAEERMYTILGRYRVLSLFADIEGLKDDDRSRAIKQSLEEEGHLDTSDTEKADREFEIISAGYELNKGLWDKRLDRIERRKD